MDDKLPLPRGFLSGWTLTMLLTGFLVALAMAPPFVSEPVRSVIMAALSGVCHQIPARSPHIDGVALGVCHRCFGTYLGLPAAAVVYLSLRGFWPWTNKTAPWVLIFGVLPALIDWSGDLFGIWNNTPVSRLITGGILGLTAGYFLVASIVDSFTTRHKKKKVSSNTRMEKNPTPADENV